MASQAALLSAIASPRRREILRLIWSAELTAGAIHQAMSDVTFAAVSLHLRLLREAGLVGVRAESRQRFYRAKPEQLGPLGQMLERMWDDQLWSLKLEAELEEARRGPRPHRQKRRQERKK